MEGWPRPALSCPPLGSLVPACSLAQVACPKACQAGVPGRAGTYMPRSFSLLLLR